MELLRESMEWFKESIESLEEFMEWLEVEWHFLLHFVIKLNLSLIELCLKQFFAKVY